MNFTLELLLLFLAASLLFTSSRLTSRHITSHRIILHHLASLYSTSHRNTLHLATPRIVSGHTSHRIASTRTIYLFHTLILYVPTNIITAKQIKKLGSVGSTSISRTYTMGLLAPGPLFGGKRCCRNTGRKDKRETLDIRSLLFTSREAGWWSAVNPLRLGRVSSNVRIRISGFHDRTGAGSS